MHVHAELNMPNMPKYAKHIYVANPLRVWLVGNNAVIQDSHEHEAG